jgi:ATP-binding cassette subfamily B protein
MASHAIEQEGEEFKEKPLAEIPEEIERLLAQRLGPDEAVRSSVAIDLAQNGQFRPGFVLLTDTRLYSFTIADRKIEEWLEVPLQTVERLEVRSFNGAALLEAVTTERSLRLARFTKACLDDIYAFSRSVNDLLPNHKEEDRWGGPGQWSEKKPEICEKCGRPIPRWFSGVCPNCLEKRRIILRLLGRIKPYWPWVSMGLILMFAITSMGLVQPYLTKILIDDVLPHHNLHLLWEILGLIIGLNVASSILSGLRSYLMAWFGEKVTFDLRQELYNHLQVLSLSFFDSKQTGWIMDRLSNDTGNLQDFLTDALQSFIRDSFQLVSIALILFKMSPRLAFMTLLPIPFITYLSVKFMKKTHKMYHLMWRRRSRLTALLTDVIPGVRVVKAFAQEDRERDRFEDRNQQYMNASLVTARYSSIVWPTTNFMGSIGFAIIWGYGGYLAVMNHDPEHGVTAGMLFMFIGYLWQFYGPVQTLSQMSQRVQRAATAAQRVFEILDTQPSVQEPKKSKEMPPIHGAVEFRNVTFGYEPHNPVVKNVSFTVAPGEMIGLVGPSGAGKSTSINLISRFYDVEDGAILIDGIDIRDVDLHSLRSQIGVVLQEPFLFHGTIAENIAYGRPEASLEEVIEAAKAANAHEFIMRMPDGYDTMAGERGARLSGGERQRISIARAILKNPKILILDEATSSVDTETEAQIREAIDRLVKNRTTFAIAHRFSTLRNADRLVVLDKGRLAEIGTHEELMAKEDGIFRRLTEVQSELSQIIAIGG